MVVLDLTHQEPEQQKTAGPNQEAAVKARRDFSSADYSPLHIERHLPSSHRRILRPRLAALVSQCVPDVE